MWDRSSIGLEHTVVTRGDTGSTPAGSTTHQAFFVNKKPRICGAFCVTRGLTLARKLEHAVVSSVPSPYAILQLSYVS